MQTFTGIGDDELLLMIKAKNLNGLSILYERYAAAIYGTIYRDVNDVMLAESILQQSFISLWDNPEFELKYSNRLFLWMLIIAKRTTVKALSSIELRYTVEKRI